MLSLASIMPHKRIEIKFEVFNGKATFALCLFQTSVLDMKFDGYIISMTVGDATQVVKQLLNVAMVQSETMVYIPNQSSVTKTDT